MGPWVGLDTRISEYSWTYRDLKAGHSVVQPVASRYADCAIPGLRLTLFFFWKALFVRLIKIFLVSLTLKIRPLHQAERKFLGLIVGYMRLRELQIILYSRRGKKFLPLPATVSFCIILFANATLHTQIAEHCNAFKYYILINYNHLEAIQIMRF
jgi:hypothetical protein